MPPKTQDLNKALIVWNIVLSALVGFLFLGINSTTEQEVESAPAEEVAEVDTLEQQADTKLSKVVYINNDTLFANMDMYEDLQDELLAEKMKLEGRYKRELEKLEKEYLELREKAPFMTQSQGEAAQAELIKKQQDLVKMEQDLTERFVEKEANLVRKIKRTINEYCVKIQPEYGFDFVLGKSEVGGIHYASEAQDITNEVLEGINEEYRAKKAVKNTAK